MSKRKNLGAAFELSVRKEMEARGLLVAKWHNRPIDGALKAAKNFFGGGRPLSLSSGFPDFIAFNKGGTNVKGVEVKMNGYLDPKEREMVKWYIENNIFSSFWVAWLRDNGTIAFSLVKLPVQKYYKPLYDDTFDGALSLSETNTGQNDSHSSALSCT